MQNYLPIFILLPILAFFISIFIPKLNEKLLSGVAIAVSSIQFFGLLIFLILWITQKHPNLDYKFITIYKSEFMDYYIDFYFDKTTAVFALVGSALTFIVSVFSRYYMHRDWGYKRYFNTVIFFFFSYNLVIFSGNFETLFIGWEFLGLCSFLLIAYYRDRFLPVKNSLKVISIFRIGDISLIITMWLSHQLWHRNITFREMNDPYHVLTYIQHHYWYAILITMFIIIAASVKSAQLPFSSWLPRAMEGPTTSSAIFYGSLSVNLGVFLLIRTSPFWAEVGSSARAAIFLIGLITSLIAISISKVQATVKTQIAYSSMAQIGLIFIEISLGLHTLALLHFAGNAFLRTYQLLVSPSLLSYKIHDMVFSYKPHAHKMDNSFLTKIKNTIYILSIKEWNLDFMKYRFLWNPLKWLGNKFNFLHYRVTFIVILLLLFFGVYLKFFNYSVEYTFIKIFAHLFSIFGLLLIIKTLTHQGNALKTWIYVASSQPFILTAILLVNPSFSMMEIGLYLSGISIAGLVGFICLKKIRTIDNDISMSRFHGYIHNRPITGLAFLLCSLALAGLPFTPTFLGIDILFSHIEIEYPILLLVISLSYMLYEISILRIYAHIFMGPHKKEHHAMAFKSS